MKIRMKNLGGVNSGINKRRSKGNKRAPKMEGKSSKKGRCGCGYAYAPGFHPGAQSCFYDAATSSRKEPMEGEEEREEGDAKRAGVNEKPFVHKEKSSVVRKVCGKHVVQHKMDDYFMRKRRVIHYVRRVRSDEKEAGNKGSW